MKFSTREDIDAPIDHVWAEVTNCEAFERQATARGVKVARTDALGQLGIGTEWDIEISFRGKPRKVDARVVGFEAPGMMRIDSLAGGVEAALVLELTELSPRRTRMELSVDMTAANISGRLLLQSLKFAKGKLDKRFSDRVTQFANGLEGQYRKVG